MDSLSQDSLLSTVKVIAIKPAFLRDYDELALLEELGPALQVRLSAFRLLDLFSDLLVVALDDELEWNEVVIFEGLFDHGLVADFIEDEEVIHLLRGKRSADHLVFIQIVPLLGVGLLGLERQEHVVLLAVVQDVDVDGAVDRDPRQRRADRKGVANLHIVPGKIANIRLFRLIDLEVCRLLDQSRQVNVV